MAALFAVSYMCFHDNNIETIFVTSEEKDELKVLILGLGKIFENRYENVERDKKGNVIVGIEHCKTLEEAEECMFNGDSLVHIKKFIKSEAISVA